MECWAAWSRVKEEMVMCEGIEETLINKVYIYAYSNCSSWYEESVYNFRLTNQANCFYQRFQNFMLYTVCTTPKKKTVSL